MPIDCFIARTHRSGRPIPRTKWEFVSGPVESYAIHDKELGRWIDCLQVSRQAHGGAMLPSPFPDLQDVEMMVFSTVRGMSVRGWEKVGGQRYYQSWCILWENPRR